jgi:hypothetical protein
MLYKLKDGHPVPCSADDPEWGAMMENGDLRRVAFDVVDGVEVSTVFLGIDHRHTTSGPPMLYESMTFSARPDHVEQQERYTNREDALKGHAALVEWVRAGMLQRD